MTCTVVAVNVPAWSTLGFVEALTSDDVHVSLAVARRIAWQLGEALDAGEYPEIEPEPWQVLCRQRHGRRLSA